MKILGISRGERFSPNMVSGDKAIFMSVADMLVKMGHTLTLIAEDQISSDGVDISEYDRVFSMIRDMRSFNKLVPITDSNKIINSPLGVKACVSKCDVQKALEQGGVSTPESICCSIDDVPSGFFPCWVKNGDTSAIVPEDTSCVKTYEEMSEIVSNYKSRGVKQYLVQRHVEGDLIKFYGVEGTDFFDWDYASKGHSKFGHEHINGIEHGYQFDTNKLKLLADKASLILGVPIYGGDCIVTPSGELQMIDFNDWPSFSRCRDNASIAIARRVVMG